MSEQECSTLVKQCRYNFLLEIVVQKKREMEEPYVDIMNICYLFNSLYKCSVLSNRRVH